ncbi:hypothetical protein AGIG_G25484 [Arapaima gigas]
MRLPRTRSHCRGSLCVWRHLIKPLPAVTVQHVRRNHQDSWVSAAGRQVSAEVLFVRRSLWTLLDGLSGYIAITTA